MNIIEAVKSDKPCRPLGLYHWLYISKMDTNIVLSKEQILGEWEVEEKKVEITYSDLKKAWGDAMWRPGSEDLEFVAEKLGLLEETNAK